MNDKTAPAPKKDSCCSAYHGSGGFGGATRTTCGSKPEEPAKPHPDHFAGCPDIGTVYGRQNKD